jgi:antitoxin CptB
MAEKLSPLKWQCRRGVKELDIVLSHYLKQNYLSADKQEQIAFKQLLELEDPVLFDLLLGNTFAYNEAQQKLIKKLRLVRIVT